MGGWGGAEAQLRPKQHMGAPPVSLNSDISPTRDATGEVSLAPTGTPRHQTRGALNAPSRRRPDGEGFGAKSRTADSVKFRALVLTAPLKLPLSSRGRLSGEPVGRWGVAAVAKSARELRETILDDEAGGRKQKACGRAPETLVLIEIPLPYRSGSLLGGAGGLSAGVGHQQRLPNAAPLNTPNCRR